MPQQIELVERLVDALVGPRPHQWEIHGPESSLEGVEKVHVHIVYSDRTDDGIGRPPEQAFRRFYAASPRMGGFRKESGGRTPSEVRQAMKAVRVQRADNQNEMLAKYGHEVHVDLASIRSSSALNCPSSAELKPPRNRPMTTSEAARNSGMTT